MNTAGHLVWWLLTWAALGWYAAVTGVVAVRGIREIRQMLRELGPGQDRD